MHFYSVFFSFLLNCVFSPDRHINEENKVNSNAQFFLITLQKLKETKRKERWRTGFAILFIFFSFARFFFNGICHSKNQNYFVLQLCFMKIRQHCSIRPIYTVNGCKFNGTDWEKSSQQKRNGQAKKRIKRITWRYSKAALQI